ncbi:MAG: glycoside hydrolase [Planctomycetes bacterium]|nr:glycoside hydrolase [Planctomycetota bacterium]
MFNPLSLTVFLYAVVVAQEPRVPQQLDIGSFAYDPAVVSEGDLSAILWKDGVTSELYLSSSDGHGVTWSAPVRVDDAPAGTARFVSNHSLAVCEGVLYAAWQDGRNGANDTYFSRSFDGGQTWSASMRLEDGYAAGSQAVDALQIVASGDYVYVAMRVDNPSGGEDIWMASSMDQGATWNPSLMANAGGADCDYFVVNTCTCGGCGGMNVFITFADDRNQAEMDDLFLRMSHNGGVSWMMNMLDEQIDEAGPGVGDVEAPEVLSVGGMTGLAIAWLEDETPTSAVEEELHVRYSPDGGHMWPIPEAVLGSGADVDNPALAFDGSTLLVAWEDDRTGVDEVYLAVSRDFGISWIEHQISTDGGAYPVLSGQGDLWAVSYSAGGFPERTEMAVSRDGAMSFLPAMDLELGGGADSDYVEIAYNSMYDNFVTAWLDDASGSNRVFTGGARSQTLQAVSPSFVPGDVIHFEASHFPISDDGAMFAVFVSRGTGNYAVPYGDGRSTGLASNPYLPGYLNVLSGTLDASGFGATVPTTVPRTPGVTWYATGLSYLVSSSTGKVYPLTLTDRIEISVQ